MEKKFREYTPMARFMSLNDEMKEMLPRAEFAMVQREIDHVQKEMSLCVKYSFENEVFVETFMGAQPLALPAKTL